MSAATVIDTVCTFFGGAYDSATHTYRTPQVTAAGGVLGVVRRAFPKVEDFNEYTLAAPGVQTGTIMVVQIPDIIDGPRVALPAIQGRRKVSYILDLHCFVWSTAAYGEDCQDFTYALRDAITARIRTDVTLGSGGIENNGFQVGEGDGRINTHIEQGNTDDGATKAYMCITFEAHAYEVG